jgi:hypothetical protein
MKKAMDNLTNKIIGFLLVVVVSLSGVAYASVTQRIGALETDKRDLIEVAEQIRIQSAVMNNQISSLTEHLDALEDGQKVTHQQIATIIEQVAQSTRENQAILKKWNDSVDRLLLAYPRIEIGSTDLRKRD